MNKQNEIVNRLTRLDLPPDQGRYALREYSQLFGWRPSYYIWDFPGTIEISNGHLVIEHGLENSAVITFLKFGRKFRELCEEEVLDLLAVSYNNLVDWHLLPNPEGMTYVFNRASPPVVKEISVEEQENIWKAEAFEINIAKRPHPNLKSLDDALIETILHWKRMLASEIDREISNENISALFNSIIFVRALEDYRRRRDRNEKEILLDVWANSTKNNGRVSNCIKKCLRRLEVTSFSNDVVDNQKLKVFDNFDHQTIERLLGDFYKNLFAPYRYDFSIMSKHALSRIYEHYVSIMREKTSPQLRLFPGLPEEESNKALGGVYTPLFIASFFARFLKEHHTPKEFRLLKTSDPACGSGIFLRTLLEQQCDPTQDINTPIWTEKAFENVLGIDVDENACHATKLSLSLLHLILTGRLPKKLRIERDESIDYFVKNPILKESFDVLVANPPFVKWDAMKQSLRKRVSGFMGKLNAGKTDLFLAHLKLGMEMVKPGGFLLYVLPHSFLLSENAKFLREELSHNFLIKFFADLSEIPVFEGIGAYVILLIVQKKSSLIVEEPNAIIVRCKGFVGHALQAALEHKKVLNDFYNVYEVPQDVFKEKQWSIYPPMQRSLRSKIGRFPKLDKFLMIKQGFVTGADDIFTLDRSEIPANESDIYRPYLKDREMLRFGTPKRVNMVVFYPVLNNQKLTEDEIMKMFPKTWGNLEKNKAKLQGRRSVLSSVNPWWRPIRPRSPDDILRPKIITPHLMLIPRFSIDEKGIFMVNRSPYLIPIERTNELELLRYFLAVLNSSVVHWQLANISHKYSHGYLMLEPNNLAKLSVPDPATIHTSRMKNIQILVDKMICNPSDKKAEEKLDIAIADLYGLDKDERLEVGMDE